MTIFTNYSEVVLGENDTTKNPDCTGGPIKACAPVKITRKIAEVNKHENYTRGSQPKNDIALIRLDEPVPLFTEDPSKSLVLPVCLPWSKNDPARFVKEGDLSVVTGWGATSNDEIKKNRRLEKNGVFFPKLLLARLPIANSKCRNVDKTLKICAGGVKGMLEDYCLVLSCIVILILIFPM